MKNRILLQVFLLIFISTVAFAQQNQTPPAGAGVGVLDGIYVKENYKVRDPLPYPPLREADVMWSKRIWRIIDLKEKINLPLGQPATKSTTDRSSLIDVLMDGMKEGSVTAYSFIADDFVLPITM